MVTSLDLLNGRLALGTIFDTEVLLQLFQCLVPPRGFVLVLCACLTLVRIVASRACDSEAIGACVEFHRVSCAIDHAAAWFWAVAERLRMALDIGSEGRLQDIFKCLGREGFL